MELAELQNLGQAIVRIETVKVYLTTINNESNITILRHKTALEMMVTACDFLIKGIQIITKDLKTS